MKADLIHELVTAEVIATCSPFATRAHIVDLYNQLSAAIARAETAEAIAHAIGHPSKAPCGHCSSLCYTPDGAGKVIRCYVCDLKTAEAKLEALQWRPIAEAPDGPLTGGHLGRHHGNIWSEYKVVCLTRQSAIDLGWTHFYLPSSQPIPPPPEADHA